MVEAAVSSAAQMGADAGIAERAGKRNQESRHRTAADQALLNEATGSFRYRARLVASRFFRAALNDSAIDSSWSRSALEPEDEDVELLVIE